MKQESTRFLFAALSDACCWQHFDERRSSCLVFSMLLLQKDHCSCQVTQQTSLCCQRVSIDECTLSVAPGCDSESKCICMERQRPNPATLCSGIVGSVV